MTWKEFNELKYWVRNINKKSDGIDHYYQRLLTAPFGLAKEDFRGLCIADIGCGPRGSLEWCADIVAERHYVDPLMTWYSRLNLAKRITGHRHTAVAEALPLDTASVDMAICLNALDHVDHPQAAAREMERVVKPGGCILVVVDIGHAATATEPHNMDEPGVLRLFSHPPKTVQHYGIMAEWIGFYNIWLGIPWSGGRGVLAVMFSKEVPAR